MCSANQQVHFTDCERTVLSQNRPIGINIGRSGEVSDKPALALCAVSQCASKLCLHSGWETFPPDECFCLKIEMRFIEVTKI